MRSKGYRRRTRKLFSKNFKKHGMPHTSKTIQQFKMGDLVDIKIDPSIVKGMPHKYYHGKTGRVFNVDKRSVGIILYRNVGCKYIERHVSARVEHLSLSRSNEDTKKRHQEYNKEVEQARIEGRKATPIKRQPAGPRKAFSVSLKNNAPVEVGVKKVYCVY
ncbi:hypothetical protein NUSPORA_02756 [Nucleospora cyclopteri]